MSESINGQTLNSRRCQPPGCAAGLRHGGACRSLGDPEARPAPHLRWVSKAEQRWHLIGELTPPGVQSSVPLAGKAGSHHRALARGLTLRFCAAARFYLPVGSL